MSVGFVVWLLAGLVADDLWLQLALMCASIYFIIELSNSNSLIRIRSRMVSSVFVTLMCCNSVLFQSISGNFVTLCLILSILLLFTTYQRPEAVGSTYYSALFMGLASLAEVRVLYFMPLLWLLDLTHLQSFSLRSWMASCLGILTPYWFFIPLLLYQQDFYSVVSHFMQLFDIHEPFEFSAIGPAQWLSFIYIQVLTVISATNFWLYNYEDRIRIRQFYGFFALTGLTASIFLIIQPQLFDPMMRFVIVCSSPFIAHYFSLTQAKGTNILFIISTIVALLLIVLNLFPGLQAYLYNLTLPLWSGS